MKFLKKANLSGATLSGDEFKFNNISPQTTINKIGTRIYTQIHHLFKRSNEFFLVYNKHFICPLEGNNQIQTYLQYDQIGGSYNNYQKDKSKYLTLKNRIYI